jgi:hypothetical protein
LGAIKVGNTWGFKVCPKWLKKKYREAVNYICHQCKRHEDIVGELTPHRIIRGNQGGLYTLAKLNSKESNVLMLCDACHKLIHSKEF